MSAAVASRSSAQHPMLRSSRPGTPSYFGFGSPAIQDSKPRDGTQSPSRATRAASDPPPSESAKRSSHFLRSNFETEPNPFEQSFSASAIRSSDTRSTARDGQEEPGPKPARRARSTSPASGARTPAINAGNPRLPSVANISSPAINQQQHHEPHQFGWGLDHSLRTGPLSPAMLHGPTPGSLGFGMANYFDPNNFRTGLTPSVHGGPSFPPQSPATAALFAMMTNSGQTPDTNGLTSGSFMPSLVSQAPRHGEMPNHFDAGFRKAMEAAVHSDQQQHDHLPPGIGLQHSMMHNMQNFATQAAPKPLNADQRANLKASASNPNGLPPPRMPFIPHPDMMNAIQPASVLGGPPNPLFLLSQATGEVGGGGAGGGGGDDAVLAATALSSLNAMQQQQSYSGSDGASPQNNGQPAQAPSPAKNAPAPGPPRAKRAAATQGTSAAGRKRKSAASAEDVEPPPPATRGRKKGSTAKKQKVAEMDEEMDSEGDVANDSAPKIGPNGKPIFETEEEKRKNFLERNRQAALKCRQRKKAWLSSLQSKVEYLTADNETLQATIQALRDEIGTLRSVLIGHKDCPVFNANSGGMSTVGKVLGGETSLPPPRNHF